MQYSVELLSATLCISHDRIRNNTSFSSRAQPIFAVCVRVWEEAPVLDQQTWQQPRQHCQQLEVVCSQRCRSAGVSALPLAWETPGSTGNTCTPTSSPCLQKRNPRAAQTMLRKKKRKWEECTAMTYKTWERDPNACKAWLMNGINKSNKLCDSFFSTLHTYFLKETDKVNRRFYYRGADDGLQENAIYCVWLLASASRMNFLDFSLRRFPNRKKQVKERKPSASSKCFYINEQQIRSGHYKNLLYMWRPVSRHNNRVATPNYLILMPLLTRGHDNSLISMS